jgi:hypothetical protein
MQALIVNQILFQTKFVQKPTRPNQGQVTELTEKITAMRSWYRIYTKIQNGHTRQNHEYGHRVETYRVVTSVPTFFVRMLGKLLDVCI